MPSPDGSTLGEVSLRWVSADSGEVEESTAVIPPAVGAPSATFRLAALVADLAEMWKGNAVVAERPDVTLDALAAEAEALAAEGTAGADELVEMIDLARRATPIDD